MGELVGGGYTLLYVYYLVWYTDLGGRGVFRRLTSLLFLKSEPYFHFISQGNSKQTPVNSQLSKTLPNMLKNK